MKIENYIDFSDTFKITKISKQINNIKSINLQFNCKNNYATIELEKNFLNGELKSLLVGLR